MEELRDMFDLQLVSLLFCCLMLIRAIQVSPQFGQDFSLALTYGLLGNAESTRDFRFGALFPEQAFQQAAVRCRKPGQRSFEPLFFLFDKELLFATSDAVIFGIRSAITQGVRPFLAVAR